MIFAPGSMRRVSNERGAAAEQLDAKREGHVLVGRWAGARAQRECATASI